MFTANDTRITFCLAVLLLIGRQVFAHPVATQPAILDITDQRQVFMDGRFFANSVGVELRVHPPVKTGERTLVADRPWEGHGLGPYNCIIKTGDTYHLWYEGSKGWCYARSNDGIHFDKPNLGLGEFEGSRDNNMVIGGGAAGLAECSTEGMMFVDPNAAEDQRFRCATRISDEYKHAAVFSSPDGIHWRKTHDKVLTFTRPDKRQHLDSQNVIFWDDRISKYVAYMRYNQHRPRGNRGRSVVRSESATLDGFVEVQDAPVVLGPDALDIKFGDMPALDYYTSGAIKYPFAQDAYYMFPQAYFHYLQDELPEFKGVMPVNAGPLHTQFAASRDGISWHRFGREPFVRLGMKGDFDSMSARVFYGVVPSVDGRELYLYYQGGDHLHGWGRDEKNNDMLRAAGLAPVQNVSIISRLVLRRDGFISARAAYAGGEFTTPLLRFTGRQLVLNVDTSASGLVRCELIDDRGMPIEGYRLAECDTIHTCNEINREVTWKGQGDLSALAGKPVRLRVVFRDTNLYAFEFAR